MLRGYRQFRLALSYSKAGVWGGKWQHVNKGSGLVPVCLGHVDVLFFKVLILYSSSGTVISLAELKIF